jgi:hypothetical protein
MDPNNKIPGRENKPPHHDNPLSGEISDKAKQQNSNAHQQAEDDMIDDAEFTAQSKNDDLDEGESARLGDDGAAQV